MEAYDARSLHGVGFALAFRRLAVAEDVTLRANGSLGQSTRSAFVSGDWVQFRRSYTGILSRALVRDLVFRTQSSMMDVAIQHLKVRSR